MHSSISEMVEKFGVTAACREFLERDPCHYINGHFTIGHSTDRIEVIEPSTGEKLTDVASGTAEDVNDAVSAAQTALRTGPWAEMKPNERHGILLRLAELIEKHAQTIGEIETLDNGKALGPCIEMDVLGGADLLRYMAGFATKIHGETRQVSAPGDHVAWTIREPIGVVGAIVPWNWPFNMALWKISAPLAAGCTIVLKPAQQTSLSMLYFAQLCDEAGLPPGVLNIVTGKGSTIGNALTTHPDVNKISFTGSTPVGRQVGAATSGNLAPVTLELGGKSPMLVFDDADPAAVAAAMRWSVFFNAGQVCSAGTRLYVQRALYGQVLEEVVKLAESMRLAPGLDPACDMGPVISADQHASIRNYISQGLDEGASLVCGGHDIESPGYFVPPTVLAVEDNQATVMQEEIFGPVLVAMPFDTEEEGLALANDNIYGLAASVWTRDISRAMRCVKALEAGTVWVNAHDLVDSAIPFGGFKQSGFGKDMGPEQLEHFLRTKAVWINV